MTISRHGEVVQTNYNDAVKGNQSISLLKLRYLKMSVRSGTVV